MGALFGSTMAALVLAAAIVSIALVGWLSGHALAEANWSVAADVCVIVLAATATVRLFSMKRGCLVLGRVACACAIVYYNLAIRPGTWLDDDTGLIVMLACLASYAALGTRFANDALALCNASESDDPGTCYCLPVSHDHHDDGCIRSVTLTHHEGEGGTARQAAGCPPVR
jgi:hypothetical protein